jgi:hypothetical protein
VSGEKVMLMAYGATENEAEQLIRAVTASAIAVGADLQSAYDAMAHSARAAAEAFTDFQAGLHSYLLLYGPQRYRKPYLKQPGEQFARFSGGRLVQFKRLADGSIVKV